MSDCHVMEGKGYAFITFGTVASAQAFLEQREHYIDGRKVDAKAAVPRDQGGNKLTKKMFVGGVSNISDEEFTDYFSQFGTVTEAQVRAGAARVPLFWGRGHRCCCWLLLPLPLPLLLPLLPEAWPPTRSCTLWPRRSCASPTARPRGTAL